MISKPFAVAVVLAAPILACCASQAVYPLSLLTPATKLTAIEQAEMKRVLAAKSTVAAKAFDVDMGAILLGKGKAIEIKLPTGGALVIEEYIMSRKSSQPNEQVISFQTKNESETFVAIVAVNFGKGQGWHVAGQINYEGKNYSIHAIGPNRVAVRELVD